MALQEPKLYTFSRVDKFFVLSDPNSAEKYLKFLKRFREFADSHEKEEPRV
jgi:hypothetical protein